jgi:hypothetical protein
VAPDPTVSTGASSRRQPLAELSVVGGSLFRVQQRDAGPAQFVQQLLGLAGMLAGLEAADMPHLAVGGVFDDVRVRFEQIDAQQAVVVRRLFTRRDAQPLVIGIEGRRRRFGRFGGLGVHGWTGGSG